MSVVICKLPKAGLGNQLFPLMRAYTFAHLNNLPGMVPGSHYRSHEIIREGRYLFAFICFGLR
jgi:hypothetical protein